VDQDAEITAMSAVAKALEPLDELARQWVIAGRQAALARRCWHQAGSVAAVDDLL
jgi:hypothetical protein